MSCKLPVARNIGVTGLKGYLSDEHSEPGRFYQQD